VTDQRARAPIIVEIRDAPDVVHWQTRRKKEGNTIAVVLGDSSDDGDEPE